MTSSNPTCGNTHTVIPRISRDQRPTAAFGDLRLHTSGCYKGANTPHYAWSEAS